MMEQTLMETPTTYRSKLLDIFNKMIEELGGIEATARKIEHEQTKVYRTRTRPQRDEWRRWANWEVFYLKANYNSRNAREIAIHLGRSIRAVHTKWAGVKNNL